MSTEINTTSANSICIPRAFANISEARVRKVFDALNIFAIDRVDMVQRKNEKGEPFQRIFVHIKNWSETADAQKARERLLTGKELKIVYDDPWFWKVSLNTWKSKPPAPVPLYDRKPRIRLDFEEEDTAAKNVDAAASLLNSLHLEDRRPYSERRVDPVYCEQDVKSGFRDRRDQRPRDDRRDDRRPRDDRRDNRDRRPRSRSRSPVRNDRRDDRRYDNKRDQRNSRFAPRSPSRSPPRNEPRNDRDYRDGYGAVIYPEVKQVITQPKPQKKPEVVAPVVEVKPAFVMNPDIRLMVATFLGIGRDEVTEEQYKNNAQFVRDLRQDDMDRQKDEDAAAGIKPLNYGNLPPAPKKKNRLIVEETKTDKEEK